jgi:hypothetical protein
MKQATMVMFILLLAVGCSGQTEKNPYQDKIAKQARESEQRLRELGESGKKLQQSLDERFSELEKGGFSSSVRRFVGKLGGKTEVDDKLPGKPVVRIDLSHSKATDQELAKLSELLEFTQAYWARYGATSKELAPLRELNLRDTNITDACLKRLTGLKLLRKLDLTGTKVTDGAVQDLKKALPECAIVR